MKPKKSSINEKELTRILPSYLLEEVETDKKIKEKEKKPEELNFVSHSDKNIFPKKVRIKFIILICFSFIRF